MNNNCIFCRIIAGELPAARVCENADTLVFMDIGPVIKGHTLVIPKQHCAGITEASVAVLEKLIGVVRKIAKAQIDGLGAKGINVTQANGPLAGQVVPHVHFHVIPRFDNDGHSRNWHPGKYDNDNEMEEYASKIREALN